MKLGHFNASEGTFENFQQSILIMDGASYASKD
jgi:hypothetical protein